MLSLTFLVFQKCNLPLQVRISLYIILSLKGIIASHYWGAAAAEVVGGSRVDVVRVGAQHSGLEYF